MAIKFRQRKLATDVQGKPVTDVCDGDVMEKCLQTKGLETYGIGKVRQCLLNVSASDIAAADEARLQAEAQVRHCSLPVSCSGVV